MILVDTSVWVDYLRAADAHLSVLLARNEVCCHPWVVGEIACRHLRNRTEILGGLQRLPQLTPAREHEVLYLIERRGLMGRGMGYIDAHLATAALAQGCRLWTRDKRLIGAVTELGVLYSAPQVQGSA